MDNSKIVEKFSVEDGRSAERHIGINESGDKVIELFVEEKKPLKLEKRIIEKRKEVLAEQIIETVKDGEVIDVQVHSIEPEVKMQLREHFARPEVATLNASEYVTHKALNATVSEAITEGFSALMANKINAQSVIVTKAQQAQMALEEQVETKKKDGGIWTYVILGAIIIAQLGYFAYLQLG